MRRIAFLLIAGLILGGIVHVATILALPATATRNAFARIAAITVPNKVALLPQPVPGETMLPYVDPAFATAVCRFDLARGPLKVRMPITAAYGSLTFYKNDGTAFYAINDRAAGRRLVELDLMTAEQRNALELDEDETAADRLIVQSVAPTGLIVMRALAPEPSALPIVRGALNAAECTQQPAN